MTRGDGGWHGKHTRDSRTRAGGGWHVFVLRSHCVLCCCVSSVRSGQCDVDELMIMRSTGTPARSKLRALSQRLKSLPLTHTHRSTCEL